MPHSHTHAAARSHAQLCESLQTACALPRPRPAHGVRAWRSAQPGQGLAARPEHALRLVAATSAGKHQSSVRVRAAAAASPPVPGRARRAAFAGARESLGCTQRPQRQSCAAQARRGGVADPETTGVVYEPGAAGEGELSAAEKAELDAAARELVRRADADAAAAGGRLGAAAAWLDADALEAAADAAERGAGDGAPATDLPAAGGRGGARRRAGGPPEPRGPEVPLALLPKARGPRTAPAARLLRRGCGCSWPHGRHCKASVAVCVRAPPAATARDSRAALGMVRLQRWCMRSPPPRPTHPCSPACRACARQCAGPGAPADLQRRARRAGRRRPADPRRRGGRQVAIVGRPNVGKSALFNRLTGANTAIVFDYPGVTRDRLYTRAAWGAAEFVVVDTGGLVSDAAALPDAHRPAPGRPPRALEPGLPQVRRPRRRPRAPRAAGERAAAGRASSQQAKRPRRRSRGWPGISMLCERMTLVRSNWPVRVAGRPRRAGRAPRALTFGAAQAIERQAAAGAAEADVLVMVVDGQAGVTAADEEIAAWLRRTHPGTPVLLAVNKCENAALADVQAADFWALGLEPVAVSAISGSGSGDLLDRLVAALPPARPEDAAAAGEAPVAVAIIGRPNVGKSSLLNALAGAERSIVSPVAGTTRDAVDTEVVGPGGARFTLIDTAGIRKRARVSGSPDGAEPLSVGRAIAAVRRAEVVLLVLDGSATAPDGRLDVAQQDFRLAELVAAEGRACVLVVNKWDAVAGKDSDTLARARAELLQRLRPLSWATAVFTSATTGQRVATLLDAAAAASAEHRRRVSTATLNLVLREAANWRSPPTMRGSARKGRIYYATQARRALALPPTAASTVRLRPCRACMSGQATCVEVARRARPNLPVRPQAHHTCMPSPSVLWQATLDACAAASESEHLPCTMTLTAHAEARRRAQAATRPPTFVCFVNDAALFADEYRRYLERQLRDNVGFPGTPLRILFRGKAPRSGAGGGRPGGAAAAD